VFKLYFKTRTCTTGLISSKLLFALVQEWLEKSFSFSFFLFLFRRLFFTIKKDVKGRKDKSNETRLNNSHFQELF
jgi:hypothetical protein